MYTKQQIELAKKNGTIEDIKGDMVDALIRERYPLSEELALLRQRDDKPEEFAAFNAYAEECKAKVNARLGN